MILNDGYKIGEEDKDEQEVEEDMKIYCMHKTFIHSSMGFRISDETSWEITEGENEIGIDLIQHHLIVHRTSVYAGPYFSYMTSYAPWEYW